MRADTQDETAGSATESRKGQATRGNFWRYAMPALAFALLAGAAFWGIESRRGTRAALDAVARDSERTPVSVVHPRPSQGGHEVELPGNLQAYAETPIYARTNGYLKRWFVDIGGRVKQGQLLAEIDTPEVDQELEQAQAAEAQAAANLDLARTTAERWQILLKSDGVSKQEVDQNVSAYKAREADLLAAKANVKRLEDLQSFKQVTAPFSGILTVRNVDVGALISSTIASSAQPLFRIAQTNVLRVYVNVPQTYSRSVVEGVAADLAVPEFPKQTFPGKVVRTSGEIDPASRTFLAEVDVPNSTGKLLPGAYATVRFHITAAEPPLVLPSNTLLFRSGGTEVAVSGGDGKVHIEKVVVGRDLGTSVEIVEGVQPNDSIILNPPDSIAEGDLVEVKPAPAVGEKRQ
ncbi:MAG: efflux RND transporter periplasmic adaptor subunit [Candidatus Acidiferrales bacterium]